VVGADPTFERLAWIDFTALGNRSLIVALDGFKIVVRESGFHRLEHRPLTVC
jgi:hypothetical protein